MQEFLSVHDPGHMSKLECVLYFALVVFHVASPVGWSLAFSCAELLLGRGSLVTDFSLKVTLTSLIPAPAMSASTSPRGTC